MNRLETNIQQVLFIKYGLEKYFKHISSITFISNILN